MQSANALKGYRGSINITPLFISTGLPAHLCRNSARSAGVNRDSVSIHSLAVHRSSSLVDGDLAVFDGHDLAAFGFHRPDADRLNLTVVADSGLGGLRVDS